MVVTGRTRNAFGGNLTRVRIPPSPFRQNLTGFAKVLKTRPQSGFFLLKRSTKNINRSFMNFFTKSVVLCFVICVVLNVVGCGGHSGDINIRA